MDLTANRLKSIDPRLLSLPSLRTLSLRQNLVDDVRPLVQLASLPTLEILILHDNYLKSYPAGDEWSLPALTKLDLSFNQLRDVSLPSTSYPVLRELYLAQNKIKRVPEHLPTTLRTLELGSNRLKTLEGGRGDLHVEEDEEGEEDRVAKGGMDEKEGGAGDGDPIDHHGHGESGQQHPPPPLPLLASPLSLSSPLSPSAQVSERKQAQPSPPPLSHLVHLRELWLARNRLSSIGWGLRGLVSLTSVSLQANRLSRMVGVGCLPNLEELYLSMNGIEVVEDVEHLPKLRVLDLAQNKLRVVANLPPRLEDLWLNNNALEACSWTELTEALAASRDTIISLYLENNPQLVDDLVSSTVATTTATTMTTTADGGGKKKEGDASLYARRFFDHFPALDQLDSDHFRSGVVGDRA